MHNIEHICLENNDQRLSTFWQKYVLMDFLSILYFYRCSLITPCNTSAAGGFLSFLKGILYKTSKMDAPYDQQNLKPWAENRSCCKGLKLKTLSVMSGTQSYKRNTSQKSLIVLHETCLTIKHSFFLRLIKYWNSIGLHLDSSKWKNETQKKLN